MLPVKPSEEGVIAARVKQARRNAGLSQRELAEKIGCSPRAVQNWERQNSREPHPRYMRALSQATGMPIPWFYGEEAAA